LDIHRLWIGFVNQIKKLFAIHAIVFQLRGNVFMLASGGNFLQKQGFLSVDCGYYPPLAAYPSAGRGMRYDASSIPLFFC